MNAGMHNLSGLHLLLTYGCTSACDHCFVYGSPRSDQVFTLKQLHEIIEQAREVPAVKTFYFEGGEPFLYYAHLLEGVRLAREAGYECGIVSNSFWASTVEDAEAYLRPFALLGLADLSVSDDEYHADPATPSRAKNAYRAARKLGIPVGSICLEPPRAVSAEARGGEPVIGGDVVFKGRAVDNLLKDLPTRPAASFTACEQENFLDVGRVHIDPFGWVHLCQGVVAGNLFEKPLKEIIATYDPEHNPIIGPLLRGGPAELARTYPSTAVGTQFVDACHLCFLVRRALIEQFPTILAPPRVYGLTDDARQ